MDGLGSLGVWKSGKVNTGTEVEIKNLEEKEKGENNRGNLYRFELE